MSSGSYDAAFESIYRSCAASGMGGDLKFVDAFFGFLARKTPLLRTKESVEQVQGLAMKHVELAKKMPKPASVTATTSAPTAAESAKPAAAVAASASSSSSAIAAAAAAPPSDAPTTTLPDASNESEEDKLPAPINNGGVTEKYTWSQTLAETTVSIPLPKGTTSKQLSVTIESNELHVSLKAGDKTVFLNGEPDENIDTQDATWTIEDDGKGNKTLELFLPKQNKMSWWKCVVKGDPCINTKKIVPENSKLDDLDADTRSTVEKMMFDQRQKQMGKPTSDERAKQEALKRFMAQHPEMDFSQAKIQ